MEKVVVGLIKGRHELPVTEYIFDESIENVHDYKGITGHICNFVLDAVGISIRTGQALNQQSYDDIECFTGDKALVVYVTGLTPVTAALIKVCALNGIQLTLMNYDSSTGEYREQFIF